MPTNMIGFGFSSQGVHPFASVAPFGKHNRQPFDGKTIRHVLKTCIDWVDSVGIELTDGRRHIKYLELLDQYPDLTNIDSIDIGEKRKLHYVIYEVHEFDRMRRYLADMPSSDIKSRLRIYIRGPFHYDDERRPKGKNYPRDIGLELTVGSEFKKRGFDILFSDSPDDPEPTILLNGVSYPVQCKRLASVKKFNRKLTDAIEQLDGNRKNNSALEPGVVVLDVTKLISENFSISTSHSALPPNFKHQHIELNKYFNSMAKRLEGEHHPSLQIVLLRASWVEYMKDVDEYWFNYANIGYSLRDGSPLTEAFSH